MSALRRLLLAGVALALVPVLVVTGSARALASTVVESDHVGVSVVLPGHQYGYRDVTCTGEFWMQWAGADATNPNAVSFAEWDGLECVGGADLSPGFSQPGEAGSGFRIWVTGDGCGSSASGTVSESSRNSWSHIAGLIGSPYGYKTGDALCDPANLCIRLTEDGPGNGSWVEACAALNIDVPPELQETFDEPTTCSMGTVARPEPVGVPVIMETPGAAGTTQHGWYQHYQFTINATAVPAGGGWGVYMVGQTVNDNDNAWMNLNSNQFAHNYGVQASTATGTWIGGTAIRTYGRYLMSAPPGSATVIDLWAPIGPAIRKTSTSTPEARWVMVGAGVFAYPEGSTTARVGYQAWWSGTAGGAKARLGKTEPGTCSYYWGRQMFDVASETTDTPAGGLEQPPPPVVDPPPATCDEDPDQEECTSTDPGCPEFSLTDPSSWAGYFTCQMSQALEGLISAIADLYNTLEDVWGWLKTLLDKLLDLAKTLFIPSPGTWGFADLQQTFATRPPGSVLVALGGELTNMAQAYTNHGQCGDLYDPDPTSGQQWDTDVTSCDVRDAGNGAMGTLRAMVAFGLITLTVIACWQLLASQVGTGEGA